MPSSFHTQFSTSFPTTQSSSKKQSKSTSSTQTSSSTPRSSVTTFVQPQKPTKDYEQTFNGPVPYGVPSKTSEKKSFIGKCKSALWVPPFSQKTE